MKTEIAVILCIYFGFCALEFIKSGFFNKENQRTKDAVVEIISTLCLLVITQPAILLFTHAGMKMFLPEYEGAWTHWPILIQFGMFLVFDDMVQYWWHRASHRFPTLYNLHRPHHDAQYMSVRIVYRNNIFYYALMPGIWFSAVLIYMGFGWVYAFYLVIKLTVIIGAHSDVRWDEPLYRIGWLSPIMWVVERVISTPSTHSAHHGMHANDGVTNYKGNYGNLLFFWDVLFGTAKITRKYPSKFGVENLKEVSAAHQLMWPLWRDKSEQQSTPD